jgi:hypothetical protein
VSIIVRISVDHSVAIHIRFRRISIQLFRGRSRVHQGYRVDHESAAKITLDSLVAGGFRVAVEDRVTGFKRDTFLLGIRQLLEPFQCPIRSFA